MSLMNYRKQFLFFDLFAVDFLLCLLNRIRLAFFFCWSVSVVSVLLSVNELSNLLVSRCSPGQYYNPKIEGHTVFLSVFFVALVAVIL